MAWPSPSDYQDAIQNPRHCFSLPELQEAEVARTPLGLPRVAAGNFASVYELRSPRGRWAVRCFLRPVSDQERRYHEISTHLNAHPLPWLVDFDYLPDGVRLGRTWYPIVKMDWVDGVPLDRHVERLRADPAALRDLADDWRRLVADLQRIGIAHGDLQQGNILVAGDEMRLVDYDGMFVPAFRGERSPELGRANYQHPARRPEDYGPELDNFSALVIYLSLRALAGDASLWRFYDGENLILTSADYRAPGSSAAFARLRAHPDAEVRALAARLASLCVLPLAQVPRLETVLTGAGSSAARPAVTPAPPSTAGASAPAPGSAAGAPASAAPRGRPGWLGSHGPTAAPSPAPVSPAPAAPVQPAAAQVPQGGSTNPTVASPAAQGRRVAGKPTVVAGGPAGGPAAVAAPVRAGGYAAMAARGCLGIAFLVLLTLLVVGWWGYQRWTGRVGPWAHVPGSSSPTSRPVPPSSTRPGSPQSGLPDLREATTLIGERRYGEAADALERARRRGLDLADPAVAREYYADLARVRSGRGQFRESLAPFREALHLAPTDAGLWTDYGWALESLGEVGAARSAYSQALRVATSEDQRAQARAGLARVGGA
jgi:aminoglycoside phosphotransferase (APT) family kinase protein